MAALDLVTGLTDYNVRPYTKIRTARANRCLGHETSRVWVAIDVLAGSSPAGECVAILAMLAGLRADKPAGKASRTRILSRRASTISGAPR